MSALTLRRLGILLVVVGTLLLVLSLKVRSVRLEYPDEIEATIKPLGFRVGLALVAAGSLLQW